MQISKGMCHEPRFVHQHTKELKRASRDRLTIPRGFRNSYEVVELASQNWEGGVFAKGALYYVWNQAMKHFSSFSCFIGVAVEEQPHRPLAHRLQLEVEGRSQGGGTWKVTDPTSVWAVVWELAVHLRRREWNGKEEKRRDWHTIVSRD